jgi:hypothetical protein
MIRIVDSIKYASCLSCGRTSNELLRSFEIGRSDGIKNGLTLCTECLGELEKQAILYQPREVTPDEIDRELYGRRV